MESALSVFTLEVIVQDICRAGKSTTNIFHFPVPSLEYLHLQSKNNPHMWKGHLFRLDSEMNLRISGEN